MTYSFDLLGVTPLLTFFNYQQQYELDPQRPKAYLAAYRCTLDSFIHALDTIPKKPHWNWDEVVETMVHFWLKQEAVVRRCEQEFPDDPQEPYLVVARIANLQALRHEFESLFEV
ncbi:hypothetical protein AWQ21_00540 [Picosynechococcus sp. PCC 7003]|uniref:hypothetical protein n=1 Tax=Picosynechococcus sp. PCC 7003 TaxID=374981 RepID=UPI00081049ED|nr:hypothetical protein [Picosynechococcus sp. PCC 7003]ANV83010.1 hypothetical protein AWQ21_00540 [Picosynechococcus sp. PCC 7003]